ETWRGIEAMGTQGEGYESIAWLATRDSVGDARAIDEPRGLPVGVKANAMLGRWADPLDLHVGDDPLLRSGRLSPRDPDGRGVVPLEGGRRPLGEGPTRAVPLRDPSPTARLATVAAKGDRGCTDRVDVLADREGSARHWPAIGRPDVELDEVALTETVRD